MWPSLFFFSFFLSFSKNLALDGIYLLTPILSLQSSSSTTGPCGNDDTDTVIEVHGITCYCCYFPGQYDRYGIPTTTITTVISIFTYVEDDSSFDHYEDESAIVVSGTKDPDAAVVA